MLRCDDCHKPLNPRRTDSGYRVTDWFIDQDAWAPSHGGAKHHHCEGLPDVPMPEESPETYLAYDRGDREYDLSVLA